MSDMNGIKPLEDSLNNNREKQKIETVLSWLPFTGLIISIVSAIIFLFSRTQWSVRMVLYILLPLGFQLFIYFIIRIICRGALKLNFPYLIGKIKFLTILLILLLCGLNLAIFLKIARLNI